MSEENITNDLFYRKPVLEGFTREEEEEIINSFEYKHLDKILSSLSKLPRDLCRSRAWPLDSSGFLLNIRKKSEESKIWLDMYIHHVGDDVKHFSVGVLNTPMYYSSKHELLILRKQYLSSSPFQIKECLDQFINEFLRYQTYAVRCKNISNARIIYTMPIQDLICIGYDKVKEELDNTK